MIHRLTLLPVLLVAMLIGRAHSVPDPISAGQWFHEYLEVARANVISDGLGVIVAVVDSGVDAGHPDLVGSVLPGFDLAVHGGNGQVDTNGHGTAMAGLIVGHGRIKGIAPAAKILPVRTGETAQGSVSSLAQGISLAVASGARVVSVSNATEENDLRLRQALDGARTADVVVVAGAGNTPEHEKVQYPAAFQDVLAVASLGQNGDRSTKSVAGPQIDIAAPGESLSSTGPNQSYLLTAGTSDATAIVAGAVALVRARYPQLKAPEVIRRLTATATDKGTPGRDDEYGHGVLNIVAALTAQLPGETAAPSRSAAAAAGEPRVPREGGGFPWWVLAALPVVGVVGIIWRRRRRTGQYSTGG